MQNVSETVLSQYKNSPVLLQLIQNFNTYLDPQADIQALYDLVINVATAQGAGLDAWGRIVGVSRVLSVAAGKFLGFDEATNVSADPFDQSPFYSGAATTSNYALSDSSFRTLIYAKALANIWDGSIPALNKILLTLFPGRGNCYVTDNGNMSLVYTFSFALTPVEAAIIGNSGVIPKPAGVSATYTQA